MNYQLWFSVVPLKLDLLDCKSHWKRENSKQPYHRNIYNWYWWFCLVFFPFIRFFFLPTVSIGCPCLLFFSHHQIKCCHFMFMLCSQIMLVLWTAYQFHWLATSRLFQQINFNTMIAVGNNEFCNKLIGSKTTFFIGIRINNGLKKNWFIWRSNHWVKPDKPQDRHNQHK